MDCPTIKKARPRSKVAVRKQDDLKKERGRQLQEAVQYCKENRCGAKSALNVLQGSHPLVTTDALHRAIHSDEATSSPQHQNSILTNVERKEFALCLRKNAENFKPKTRNEQTRHVVEILRLRKATNKLKFSTQRHPLTAAEENCLKTGEYMYYTSINFCELMTL
jgi:hypothetical protein